MHNFITIELLKMLVLSNQNRVCKIYKCNYAILYLIMAIFKLILISKFFGAMYALNIDFLRDKRKIYKNFSRKLHITVMILMIT